MQRNCSSGSRRPTDLAARHVRQKRLQLARDIRDKTKIYLDTKYWILLREERLGRSKNKCVAELLSRLECLVRNGHAICPLNADVFFEVFKQNDPRTLTATARLLDDLSCGVTIIPMTERLPLEAFHFVESCLQVNVVNPLEQLIWTKVAYITGFTTPDCYNLPDEDNAFLQKRFVDYLWELTLTDCLNTMGVEHAAARDFSFPDISEQANLGKQGIMNEHRSFKSLFLSEVRGILDTCEIEFSDLMHYLYERDTGKTWTSQSPDKSGKWLANLVYHAFRFGRIAHHFPTIQISAGLHAAVRWDRKRKYKPNDQLDFRHAEAALPYCDYFFTERSLNGLLRDRSLKFNKMFACTSCADPADAIRHLAAIKC
jgi:hypothetical protein